MYLLKTLFHRFLLAFKVFVSFKDRVMTEGGPSLILRTYKNSNQMPKVINKDTGLISVTCLKLSVMSLEQY